MTGKSQVEREGRRAFLKELAVAGGTTAMIATTGRALAGGQPEPAAPAAEETKGYRVTPHIETYYRKARI